MSSRKQNEKETTIKMTAARRENWSTALEIPHEAIKNSTFLSLFKTLTSLCNLSICAVSEPVLL
jgi:hypothetical protein